MLARGIRDLLLVAPGVMLAYLGVLHLVRTEAISRFYDRYIPRFGLILGEHDTTRLFGYALVIVWIVVVVRSSRSRRPIFGVAS